jgi:hypothetical protein
MRVKLVVALAMTAALAIGATASFGADSAKTRVKITEGGPNLFEGTVSSKEPKCEKGRKVSLIYEVGKQETVVGKDKTDKNGNWEMPGNYFAGNYHAEVKAKTIQVNDKRGIIQFLCDLAEGRASPF